MSLIETAFLGVLNMSLTASYVAIGVILVRALLKKSPKIFSYVLWAVVLFRLICPISIPLTFSMLGFLNSNLQGSAPVQHAPQMGHIAPQPVIVSGIAVVDNAINRSLPAAAPAASVDPMQMVLSVVSAVWLAGLVGILAYSVFVYCRMKRTLATATHVRDNIFETDHISTAFVCGFIKPRIYVPLGLGEAEMAHILEHERTHIRRRDHLVKPLAFLALSLHWFNPLMWFSFVLMSRDMEMSCDETVLARVGHQEKISYSSSLLSLSTLNRGLITASPLAFSESHVKDRIRNVLNYRRPQFWMSLVAAVAVVVAVVVLAGNPKDNFSIEALQAQARQFSSSETDLAKVGEEGVLNYYASFMDKSIPKEYRILSYETKQLTVLAGDEREFAVGVTADYNAASLYFLSANGEFKPQGDWYECTGDYKEFRIKKVGANSYQIVSIGTGGGLAGLLPLDDDGIPMFVENQLSLVMSALPPGASNPYVYIQAGGEEYEKIIKLGGEAALSYLLSEFAAGNTDGLRGAIMLQLCKDMLGPRNNVTDDTLSPAQWYQALSIREEIVLPDFVYDGHPDGPKDSGRDLAMYLAYSHEQTVYSAPERGFTVVAIHSHGNHAEGDKLKIFVTTFSATYRLYGDVIEMTSGSVVPAALTFYVPAQGVPMLIEYQQAKDGGEWSSSIREMSKLNGKEIPGLADRIMTHYGNYSDLSALQLQNLRQHLLQNGIKQATYTNSRGEVVLRIP